MGISHLKPENEFVRLSLDYEWARNRSIFFLREYLSKHDKKRVVIGNSGGVDSATTIGLATMALGPENVITVKMPCGSLGYESALYADVVNASFDIFRTLTVDIKDSVDALAKTLLWTPKQPNAAKLLGNIMARCRMIVLYHAASSFDALVLGTENRTEHLLKYFTLWGDSGTDIEIIRWLFKTQVWELADFLGVPPKIINRKPTADLWVGQTDEGEMGVSYQLADQILHCRYDRGLTQGQIIALGLPATQVRAVFALDDKFAFKLKVPVALEVFNWWQDIPLPEPH